MTAPPTRSGAGLDAEAPPDRTTAHELYRAERRTLFALAIGLTGSAAVAEDVVQEVFEAVIRRDWQPNDAAAEAAYLRAAVVNRSRSAHRRARVRRRYEASLPRREQFVSAYAACVEHADVHAALYRLSRRQREVIVLRYWADLTVEQIAHALDCSTGNVTSIAGRARARLAELLEVRDV